METEWGALAGQFTLRWTAPPGWETPPGDFVPDLQWRPNAYWPEAPEDWEFWQVIADDEIVALFHQPIRNVPGTPKPVWVAPPTWPAAPEGWHPPASWSPDPTWTPAPLGWQFWRQPETDHRAQAEALLSTRPGQLFQLNALERLFRSFAEHVLRVDGPDVKRQLAVLDSRKERRRRQEGLRAAYDAASEGLVNARSALLWTMNGDRAADAATVEWQALVKPRIDAAIGWMRHVLMLRAEPSPEAQRLSALNSRPYGATDWDPDGVSAAAPGQVNVSAVGVDWQEAERLAAMALQQFGFRDATITMSGADGGIDVQSSKIVAQVKYTSQPVGRPIIQQIIGAAGGRAAACFAKSGYTEQARVFADERGVALFVITLPTTVEAGNAAARQLMGSPEPR